MPEGGGPSGPGSAVLFLLIIFAVGGFVGIVYTAMRQNTIRENMVVVAASIVVIVGFLATVSNHLSLDPFLLVLGTGLVVLLIWRFEQRE